MTWTASGGGGRDGEEVGSGAGASPDSASGGGTVGRGVVDGAPAHPASASARPAEHRVRLDGRIGDSCERGTAPTQSGIGERLASAFIREAVRAPAPRGMTSDAGPTCSEPQARRSGDRGTAASGMARRLEGVDRFRPRSRCRSRPASGTPRVRDVASSRSPKRRASSLRSSGSACGSSERSTSASRTLGRCSAQPSATRASLVVALPLPRQTRHRQRRMSGHVIRLERWNGRSSRPDALSCEHPAGLSPDQRSARGRERDDPAAVFVPTGVPRAGGME